MTEVAWRRLSIRTFYLGLIRAALSTVPGLFGLLVLGDRAPVWPLVAGSVAILLGAVGDLRRWQTTRYRVTADAVEMRTGWLSRRHRTVARDRIRSVDSTAKGLSRLLGLHTVHVGSGESESSFQLNALDANSATRLQQELMLGAAEPGPAAESEPVAAAETLIARLRPGWIPLNVVSIWAPFTVAGSLFSLYWFLRPFGIDLLKTGIDWNVPTIVWLVLLSYPVGTVLQAAGFLLDNWNFRLVRAGTPPATALVTRKGLLTTRTVHRDDERLRGIAFAEPLVWRWLGVAETQVLATGLRHAAGAATSGVLPRLRMAEARGLAGQLLPDGELPLDAPLAGHPRAALTRRLLHAVLWPIVAAGAMVIIGLSWWPAPLLLLAGTVPLALGAYRSLGHTLTARYLVIRSGILSRRTVALQKRAVIGWTFEQSILQRRRGLITVKVATAAGSRSYEAPDCGVDQARAFVRGTTPELAELIQ